METDKWQDIIEGIDFAFQPIVNIHNGVCLGYEALIRDYQKFGFSSIHDLFDSVYNEGHLFKFDILLREKAIKKFINIKDCHKFKLFFNLENRIILCDDYKPGLTLEILKKFNLPPNIVCFEISERHELNCSSNDLKMIHNYKRQTYKIAIDDFGSGYAGLQLLYHTEPDYIKIDRFFISGIENDSKKKLFVAKVVNIAHILGIQVIAEGVESENEFYLCKEINCDYIQGYLIQAPTVHINELMDAYDMINELNAKNKRDINIDKMLLNKKMEYIEPICVYNHEKKYFTDLTTVFDAFRRNKDHFFFPVVNDHNEPIGLVREKELKEYVYSKYGKDLLMNKTIGKTIMDFVVKCHIMDINTKIEKILEYYAIDDTSEGILLTDNGKYIGFLSSRSLIKVLNEKNIALARDQNPLTRLPGNTIIHEYIEHAIASTSTEYILVYFDFDNFKPFNDKYGFRQGDRAILMFADLLKKSNILGRFFIGHIGGDDFFAGYKNDRINNIDFLDAVKVIINKFRDSVLSLYDAEDRKRGYIISHDRDGIMKQFPLLTVSAAVICMSPNRQRITLEELNILMAKIKKEAKKSPNKIVCWSLEPYQSEKHRLIVNS
ncbi:MAG TPA: GGDEF domain-containing protein [Syntrophorhabdaceae bacterium]|nr:GGDEF domain-containing protein [Syntrophorhabdaceae bacterium]